MSYKNGRIIESQFLLRYVQAEATGVYLAKEAAEKDNWRDKTIWQNIAHLAHEIEEVRRSKTIDRQYHNALDCVGQSSIIAAQLYLDMQEMAKKRAYKLSESRFIG